MSKPSQIWVPGELIVALLVLALVGLTGLVFYNNHVIEVQRAQIRALVNDVITCRGGK